MIITYKNDKSCHKMSKNKIKGDVHMTNQERIEKYKKENCSTCTKNIDCKIVRRIDSKLTYTEEE